MKHHQTHIALRATLLIDIYTWLNIVTVNIELNSFAAVFNGICLHLNTATYKVVPIINRRNSIKEALLSERERQKHLPKRDNRVDGYGNWVFLNRYGLALKADSVNSAINRIINQYNTLEKENAYNEGRKEKYLPHQTNHMLRHTYCTRMIEKCCEPNSGITVKVVQYLMGHEDAKTTLDIYTDVHKEFVKKTMSRFEGENYLG